ncbi:MAG: CDP-glycerol glycerophosphotransferase family protein [Clostridiales bacterium]|nr:CDP-glycerol glycerophosphotransferase family protein [Clostridiales bacterium]
MYKIFALNFNLCARLMPAKKNLVVLLSPHNASFNDSLGEMEKEFTRRGGFEIYKISCVGVRNFDFTAKSAAEVFRFFTKGARMLARAEYVFLNDNFMPLSELKFKKTAVITQLWHAEGAFKKFGLSLDLPEDIRKRVEKGNSRLTWVTCTSKRLVPIYAEAFGVPEEKILPIGSPRVDSLLDVGDTDKIKEKFLKKYPACAGKKIVLYAPTFRDDELSDSRLLYSFDFKKFDAVLGDEYALVVRLHPQFHKAAALSGKSVDATGYPNVGELVKISDLLITDYSSVCMDFALLNKPMIFYAFDLNEYISTREFYFDYYSYVPGTVAENFNDLLEAVKNKNFGTDKTESFVKYNFDAVSSHTAAAVADAVIGRKEQLK